MITDDGGEKALVLYDKMKEAQKDQEGDLNIEAQMERRRSERLKKDVHLTTMDKNEAMAKKRNLEVT